MKQTLLIIAILLSSLVSLAEVDISKTVKSTEVTTQVTYARGFIKNITVSLDAEDNPVIAIDVVQSLIKFSLDNYFSNRVIISHPHTKMLKNLKLDTGSRIFVTNPSDEEPKFELY